jgi:hypothetical protein
VTKYFAHVKPLTLAGTTYTPATLTAVLEAEIAANKAVDENEAQLRQQVVAAKLARAKALAARTGLKAYILGNSGADAVQMLTDFGIPVPKSRGPRTARSKALAVDSHRHAQGEEGGDRVDPCARPPPPRLRRRLPRSRRRLADARDRPTIRAVRNRRDAMSRRTMNRMDVQPGSRAIATIAGAPLLNSTSRACPRRGRRTAPLRRATSTRGLS